MARCPFYGRRWPDRSPELARGAANECGLDFLRNGACGMEREGREVNFFCCPTVLGMLGALEVAKAHIRVPAGSETITLGEWMRRNR